MKAVVAAFNQEKDLVGAISVITNLRMELFEALLEAITMLRLPQDECLLAPGRDSAIDQTPPRPRPRRQSAVLASCCFPGGGGLMQIITWSFAKDRQNLFVRSYLPRAACVWLESQIKPCVV